MTENHRRAILCFVFGVVTVATAFSEGTKETLVPDTDIPIIAEIEPIEIDPVEVPRVSQRCLYSEVRGENTFVREGAFTLYSNHRVVRNRAFSPLSGFHVDSNPLELGFPGEVQVLAIVFLDGESEGPFYIELIDSSSTSLGAVEVPTANGVIEEVTVDLGEIFDETSVSALRIYHLKSQEFFVLSVCTP